MDKIVLATDLGGTNLRMAAVGHDGSVLSRVKHRTPRSDGPEEIVRAMVRAAGECRAELDDHEPVALAAAVPGTINFDKGLIFKAPNLPELDRFPMVAALERELGISAVLENDANAAAVGESWLGAARGYCNSITVTLGTGVGGGIVIGGRILRGIDGTAGEIGHINVEPEGIECGCGSYGCVEQYSSATALVRMARELKVGPDGTSADGELTSEALFDLAQNGDERALEVFRKQGYYLGLMLAGLVNTLNPEAIVIGGGAAGGWDLFIGSLTEQIRIRCYSEPAARAKIVRAELGDDAGLLGVARLGFER